MSVDSCSDEELQSLINDISAGDNESIGKLIDRSCDRLRRLTRKMLRRYPGVHRWVQTDDVLQNAVIRLLKSLKCAKPESAQHYFRLAALQVRRELIELARHYYGPEGMGANHASDLPADGSENPHHPTYEKAESTNDPQKLADWTEFHEQVELLPQKIREAFELIYYLDLTYKAAARVLDTPPMTVRRQYTEARLRLGEFLKDSEPE